MSSIEERLHLMQQQLDALQVQINTTTSLQKQPANNTTIQPLHSLDTKSRYEWTPSDDLTKLMNLDAPLHTSPALTDSERKTIVESYPPMSHIEYKAPATIPSAERKMSKAQRHEDKNLENLQNLLSDVFRPLDILSHELFTTEASNPNLKRYCTILRDIRKLLLHLCATMNQARNNIALRAIDPNFVSKPDSDVTYTLPLDEFENILIQQETLRKVIQEASVNRRPRRRFQKGSFSNSGSFSNFSE